MQKLNFFINNVFQKRFSNFRSNRLDITIAFETSMLKKFQLLEKSIF